MEPDIKVLLNSSPDSDDDSAPLLKSALLLYAASLASDLAPVRNRLNQISQLNDADDITSAIQQLKSDLPSLLDESLKKSTSDSVLADSMAANFLNGVNKSDDSKVTLLDKPEPFASVADRIKSDGTIPENNVDKIGDDIADRADWSDANVKAVLLSGVESKLDELLESQTPDNPDAGYDDMDMSEIAGLADDLDFDDDEPADGVASKSTVLMTILGIVGIAGGLGVYEASSEDPDCGGFILYRKADVVEPRPWPEIWTEAGGTIYDPADSGLEPDYPEGIMAVGPADVGIFSDISDYGIPVAPLRPRSQMDIAPISVDEAAALGIPPNQDWPDVDLNARVQFKAPATEGIRNILLQNLGDEFEYYADAGVIQLKSRPVTNSYSRVIRQIRNRRETADAIRNCKDYNEKQMEPAWKLMMPRKIRQPFKIANNHPVQTARKEFRVPGRKLVNDGNAGGTSPTGSMSSLGSYGSQPFIKSFSTRK